RNNSWRLAAARLRGRTSIKTSRWRRLRRFQLIQHPLCKFCLERGLVTPGERGRSRVTGRLQRLCEPCHKSAKRLITGINARWPARDCCPVGRFRHLKVALFAERDVMEDLPGRSVLVFSPEAWFC